MLVPGMPAMRFWELEDETFDPGRISFGPGDLGAALLVETALAYAGDWCVVPAALAAGALMLLGCDLRVGADIDCKIGLNEVAIGMVLPAWALTSANDRLSRRHIQLAVALQPAPHGAGGHGDVLVLRVRQPRRLAAGRAGCFECVPLHGPGSRADCAACRSSSGKLAALEEEGGSGIGAGPGAAAGLGR